jgi:stress-induced morphogen
LYAAIAIGLAVAVWTFKKNFLKLMLGSQLELPDRVWMRLNVAWIIYCVFMACDQCLRGGVLQHRGLGGLQDLGLCIPGGFPGRPGLLHRPHLKGDDRQGEVMTCRPPPLPSRRGCASGCHPPLLQVLDESADHAGHVRRQRTGFGTHFRVRIAAPQFEGRTRVQRHRLVYDALQDFIDQGPARPCDRKLL